MVETPRIASELAFGAHEDAGFRSVFVSADDGLQLHVRDYGERHWPSTPVICLPGLARTSADFHELALFISRDDRAPRRVLTCDMRGRGRSDHDPKPAHYDVGVEAADVVSIAAALGAHKAVFIGASRGGLQIMALAALRPAAIAAAILVDIGPVIEGKGLARIRGYLGKMPASRDVEEAAATLKRLGAAQFPAWSEAQWLRMAKAGFRRTPKGLVADYDPALARTLANIDIETRLPSLWPLFEALRHVPVLTIRGGNSDILSAATLAEMARRHPACATITVPGEGHVPDVGAPALAARIAAFIAGADTLADGPAPRETATVKP